MEEQEGKEKKPQEGNIFINSGIVYPIIHSNGTSANSLLDDIKKFNSILIKAEETLSKTCPNKRDYYLQEGIIEQGKQILKQDLKINKNSF